MPNGNKCVTPGGSGHWTNLLDKEGVSGVRRRWQQAHYLKESKLPGARIAMLRAETKENVAVFDEAAGKITILFPASFKTSCANS